MNLQSDLETLQFAEKQEARLQAEMTGIAVENEEIGRLLHIAGFGVITAVTVYAAIGDIKRFAEAKKLVGYAGLGVRVHDSGMTTRTGKITKAGRRIYGGIGGSGACGGEFSHPHWKAELARLEPRLGYNKTIVAIARKLLITVWHVLARKVADRFAEPEKVSKKMLHFAYEVGKANRAGKSAAQFARERLDILNIGEDLTSISWGSKKLIPLPPSALRRRSDVPNTKWCKLPLGDPRRGFAGSSLQHHYTTHVNASQLMRGRWFCVVRGLAKATFCHDKNTLIRDKPNCFPFGLSLSSQNPATLLLTSPYICVSFFPKSCHIFDFPLHTVNILFNSSGAVIKSRYNVRANRKRRNSRLLS